MKKIIFGLLLVSLFIPVVSHAGDVAVLGFVMGKATLKEVLATLEPKSMVERKGINKWTGGVEVKFKCMRLVPKGPRNSVCGIDKLLFVTFGFDKQGKQVKVFMELLGNTSTDVLSILKEKHTLVSETKGEYPSHDHTKSALFREGDILIEYTAPDYKNTFERVLYIFADLKEAIEKGEKTEYIKQRGKEKTLF